MKFISYSLLLFILVACGRNLSLSEGVRGPNRIVDGDTEKIVFIVGGLSCISCAERLEKTLESKENIVDVTVNFEALEATVTFKTAAYTAEQLISIIENMGFEAEIKGTHESKTEDIILNVAGMSCTSCAARLKKTLEKRPEVTLAVVNFEAGQVKITVLKDSITAKDLIKIINDMGFEASETVR